MSDRSQKTEKPTPRRLQKARGQGQFPQAKEFVASIQFAAIVALLAAAGAAWMSSVGKDLKRVLVSAFVTELTPESTVELARQLVVAGFLPVTAGAGVLMAVTLVAQLVSTNMGFSLDALTPNFSRLNPMGRLRQIPRQNLPAAVQAGVLLAVMAYTVHLIVSEHLADFLRLPLMSVHAGVDHVTASIQQLLWRMAAILVVFGAVEFLRQRWIYHSDLAMTKQEIREEHKESEGDPHIKARVRRLRRDLLRRQMIREVPKATAVIVNPTHYAVAIRYEMQAMASPVVVAKGRNYLAARIRQIAIENGIAIVENPPLARALYESVDVGREIPPNLYRAVAEVLAYVYRMVGMKGR